MHLLEKILPRHLEIIYEINAKFLDVNLYVASLPALIFHALHIDRLVGGEQEVAR